MSFKLQAWLVAVLAAGVLAAWIRARRDPESKTARGRLRQLGWCLAFVALTISVTATVTSLFERNGLVSWLLIIAVGVAVATRAAAVAGRADRAADADHARAVRVRGGQG